MGMMAMVARAFYTERFQASEQGASLPREECAVGALPIITSIVVPHSKSKSHIPNTASISYTSTRLQDEVGNYVGLDIGQVETLRIPARASRFRPTCRMGLRFKASFLVEGCPLGWHELSTWGAAKR